MVKTKNTIYQTKVEEQHYDNVLIMLPLLKFARASPLLYFRVLVTKALINIGLNKMILNPISTYFIIYLLTYSKGLSYAK